MISNNLLLFRRKCLSHDHVDSLDKLKCKLDKLKKAAFEAQIELKETVTDTLETMEDNINEQIDSWTESLKNSLLTRDMQDALGTIQSVLGRLLGDCDKKLKNLLLSTKALISLFHYNFVFQIFH